MILRDRRALAMDGVVTVALTVASATGRPVSGPDLTGRGFLSDPDDPLLEEARAPGQGAGADRRGAACRAGVSEVQDPRVLSRFFYEKTHRRPMILPIVLEV